MLPTTRFVTKPTLGFLNRPLPILNAWKLLRVILGDIDTLGPAQNSGFETFLSPATGNAPLFTKHLLGRDSAGLNYGRFLINLSWYWVSRRIPRFMRLSV